MKDNTPTNVKTSQDLQDSPDDEREMYQEEETVIDLPDVSDIPGQENVVPAPLGEMADETISSADEEGDDLFDDDIDEEIEDDPDSNVTETEVEDLEETATDMPSPDNIKLREAALDNTDNDGVPLNEGSFKNDKTGDDLDVPGAELDDADEAIGEEDEENNDYSLGGDQHFDTREDNY